jgi:hypothetical protein
MLTVRFTLENPIPSLHLLNSHDDGSFYYNLMVLRFICFVNMQIWKSSHAVHALGYHLIFCLKYRHQVFEGAIEVELKRIFVETCKTYGWELIAL